MHTVLFNGKRHVAFNLPFVLKKRVMVENNKHTLLMANAAIDRGDHEEFLTFCTDDTVWNFVGEQVLRGKDEVRRYMAETYLAPPVVEVTQLVAEGDFVTAMGKIKLKDAEGNWNAYEYCDVWKFRDGKLHQLRAFVVASTGNGSQADGFAEKTVVGSGYSYDEPQCPTDESEPIDSASGKEVVELPDLGKPLGP